MYTTSTAFQRRQNVRPLVMWSRRREVAAGGVMDRTGGSWIALDFTHAQFVHSCALSANLEKSLHQPAEMNCGWQCSTKRHWNTCSQSPHGR